MLKKELNTKTIIINYFTYSLQDAQFFLYNLALAHPKNHLYVTKENLRYNVRGYIVYEGNDLKFEQYQIAYLADYCSCNKYNPEDDSKTLEINFRRAG